MKNIKTLPELNLVDRVILSIISNHFFNFLVRIREIGFQSVFNLLISLMTLIVPTLLHFRCYYVKNTNCWERNFSLNLFSRNMLWRLYPWRYFIFSLSCGFMRNRWLHGCVHLTINHEIAKFQSHRSCQRGYVTLLVYHVTTHYHIVWGSRDSIGGFLS